jgi:DNA-binding response OmpR family regulator
MMKILIIEDDPIIANIYRSRLEKEGFQVEIASDGQTGFYRVHELHPDAILLDLMLPKIDGIQILRKVRAQKLFQGIPIIVFTNAYVPNMIQEANDAGATQVFNKAALTPRQIVEAINNALYPSVLGTTAAPAPTNPLPVAGHGTPVPPVSPLGRTPLPAVAPLPNATLPFSVPPLPAGPSRHPLPAVNPIRTPPPVEPPRNVPEESPQSVGDDSGFQSDLMNTFLKTAPEVLASLRKLLHEFLKNTSDIAMRQQQLFELYRKVHAITGNAAIVGLQNISQMSSALEALLKELYEKPKNITASTRRSVAHAIDFLCVLFDRGTGPSVLDNPPIAILVVDDEVISRRAVLYALEKAQLKAESLEDPIQALPLVAKRNYDLVILDVDMPGMNGFELCAKLRAHPLNQNTPVVFVTNMSDFESRARSSLSGGNDLIAKPFLFIELTVKALSYVLKNRLGLIKV